jgi:hypothetical protein
MNLPLKPAQYRYTEHTFTAKTSKYDLRATERSKSRGSGPQ